MAILPPSVTGRPQALAPIFENFPPELTALDQWVLWCYQMRDERWTKVPHNKDRRFASVKDTDTWASFNTVVEAYGEGWADGVGFVLTPEAGILALDFDQCDAATARPWLFPGSYAERSPSGEGIRQFIFASLPEGARNKYRPPGMKELELYDRERYMTVTGHRI
jgi:primase-polymerase (primpol)-like protein